MRAERKPGTCLISRSVSKPSKTTACALERRFTVTSLGSYFNGRISGWHPEDAGSSPAGSTVLALRRMPNKQHSVRIRNRFFPRRSFSRQSRLAHSSGDEPWDRISTGEASARNRGMRVRVSPVPPLFTSRHAPRASSNGRTPVFQAGYVGSSPSVRSPRSGEVQVLIV